MYIKPGVVEMLTDSVELARLIVSESWLPDGVEALLLLVVDSRLVGGWDVELLDCRSGVLLLVGVESVNVWVDHTLSENVEVAGWEE